jgi:hypothetical protein
VKEEKTANALIKAGQYRKKSTPQLRERFQTEPFNEYFDRWLTNVEAVLSVFESHPNISVDEQFVRERTETLVDIKLQLEGRRRKEASLDQEIKNLAYYRIRLKQINTEYETMARAIKLQKTSKSSAYTAS